MNKNALRLLALIVCISGLVLAACGGTISSSSSSTSPSSSATLASTPSPTATASASSTSSSGCPNGSLESCYSYSQMSSFLDQAKGLVQPFFTSVYRGLPSPSSVVFVPARQMGRTSCGTVDAEAYEYCGANDRIYIGQDLLWAFYHQFGDAAPVVALAHEWGHHIQAYMRVPQPQTAAQSVKYEDQADCIAGAWSQYAAQKGILEATDDLADVSNLLRAIGSREGVDRDHGTASERRDAFDLGYNGGLKACNSFFPNNPVYDTNV